MGLSLTSVQILENYRLPALSAVGMVSTPNLTTRHFQSTVSRFWIHKSNTVTMMRSFLLLLALASASGFTVVPSGRAATLLAADRRGFLDASFIAGAALVLGQPAFADDGDLSMPSPQEIEVRWFICCLWTSQWIPLVLDFSRKHATNPICTASAPLERG